MYCPEVRLAPGTPRPRKCFTAAMEGWEPHTYGERVAGVYDELYEDKFDKEATADFLAERAGGGPALELAIGTGRVALPLKKRGVEVHGIDASPAMVERMRAKDAGADIPVSMGDFGDVAVDRDYPLVYIAFNTFFALTTQEDQVRCFQNVAQHLTDDGVFVVEGFVPDMGRYKRHQNFDTLDVELDRVMLDATRHDPVTQTIKATHIIITPQGNELYPVFLRYAYPPELDLMARLAGLALRERYANYKMDPFTADSHGHVSVYGKA